MKKFMATLTAMAVILSLTACGNPPEQEKSSSNAEPETSVSTAATTSQTEITAGEVASDSQQTTIAPDEASSVPPEEEVVPTATSCLYENGIACLGYYEEGVHKYSLYDVSENKMYDIGNMASYCHSNNIYIVDNGDGTSRIFNIQTGEEIYSGKVMLQQVDELTETYCNNNRVITVREEEGFAGNKVYVSVLNDSGEWEISPDEALCFDGNLEDYEFSCFSPDTMFVRYDCFGDNKSKDTYSLYAFDEKNMIWDEIYGDLPINENLMIDYPVYRMWGILWYFHEGGYSDKLTCYDSTSGSMWYEIEASKGFCGLGYLHNGRYFLFQNYDPQGIFDVYTYTDYIEKVSSFDLSKYKDVQVIAFNKDKACFTCENDDGDSYIGLMDSSGNFVFEPVKATCDKPVSMNDKFIVDTRKKSYDRFVINIETGELTYPDEKYGYEIEGFDSETNMLFVSKDGSHYLVDCNDLGTLINPFER